MRRSNVLALVVPLALVFGLARPAAAQFGLSGGMNLSKFVGGSADEDESRNKLRMGVSMSLINIGPVSVGPEIHYAHRGGRQTAPTTEPNPLVAAYDFKMNYIEVPLIARVSLFRVGPLRPYLAGGPVYAWQLKCDVSFVTLSGSATGEEQDCQDDTFTSARTAYKNADKGIVLGGGIDLSVLRMGAVSLDARMLRGLDRLTEDSADGDIKNQSVSLMLGYRMGI